MPDTEANPANTDGETLRRTKDGVQARIDRISNNLGVTSDKATSALRMKAWFELSQNIDIMLLEFEQLSQA